MGSSNHEKRRVGSPAARTAVGAIPRGSMSKRQRTGNEDDADGDAGAAEMAPERPRWFVVNAEEDTFTLNDAQEAARRADPTTSPIPRKESYDFKADPAAHRKFCGQRTTRRGF